MAILAAIIVTDCMRPTKIQEGRECGWGKAGWGELRGEDE